MTAEDSKLCSGTTLFLLICLIVVFLPLPASAAGQTRLDGLSDPQRFDRELHRVETDIGRMRAQLAAERVPTTPSRARMVSVLARLHALELTAAKGAVTPQVRQNLRRARLAVQSYRRELSVRQGIVGKPGNRQRAHAPGANAVLRQRKAEHDALQSERERIRQRKTAESVPFTMPDPLPDFAKPANDDCAKGKHVGFGTYTGKTTSATNDGTNSCTADSSRDVWFEFNSPVTGAVYVNTNWSDFDTVLSVHTSCPGTAANEIACNDNCGWNSDACLNFSAVQGTVYRIRLGGSTDDEWGNYRLNVEFPSITGTVTESDTSLPIANLEIDIYDSAGDWTDYAYTDSSGGYAVTNLAAGTYYARTWNYSGYLDELYDDIPCTYDCDPLTGTPITVVNGITTTGIDFALASYGRIRGTVTSEVDGSPIPYSSVDVYDTFGNSVAYGYADSSGTYSANYLPTGNYYVRTEYTTGYVDELYDNVPCETSCSLTLGTLVPVTFGATTEGINFALGTGGGISGQVTDAATGSPITDGYIDIYDSAGEEAGYAYLDGTGSYLVQGMMDGNYHAVTYTWSGYINEIYDNIPCTYSSCPVNSGTPISVTAGTVHTGVDFALDLGGSISGRVTDAPGSTGLPWVSIQIYDSTGVEVFYGNSDNLGYYTADGLPTGNYFARTAYSTYQDELYNDIVCDPDCNVLSGTSIAVTTGADTPGVNFALLPGGSIAGRVTSAATGGGISGVEIDIYDSSGDWVAYGHTDGTGHYTVEGLASGTFFASTYSYGNYLDELYNDIPCEPYCSPLSGTPIVVTAGNVTSNINFALSTGGRISGRVTNTATGAALPYVSVSIYDSSGDSVSYGYTDATGNYTAAGLPTGTYHALTENWDGYLDELYNDIPCEPYCDPAAGTNIPVAAGANTGNINFALDYGGTISGRLTDSTTGAGIPYAGVDIYSSDGSYASYGYTDSTGNYAAGGLNSGNFYVVTSNWGNYLDELYDNISCEPSCDPLTGTAVAVTAGSVTPNINFALDTGGQVTGNVASPTGPLAYVGVELYTSSGAYISSGYTDDAGNYWANGLPSGSYYARTWNDSGYIDELYDDMVCDPDCDVTSGTPIPVTAGSSTPGIDFILDPGGTITGIIRSESTGQNLPWVSVTIYDSSGTPVGYGYSNTFGIYSVLGLPSGSYYASTYNEYGYLDELYDNIPCPAGVCNVAAGTPISVTAGSITNGIDFLLGTGGIISGHVAEAGTGAPLESAYVEIYDSSGNYLYYGYTDMSGSYTVGGLSTGQYFARAWRDPFIPLLYDGILCPDGACDPTTGTPIDVTIGSTTGGIDFQMSKAGQIMGWVTNSATHNPLSGITVELYDSSGALVLTRTTGAGGSYQVTNMTSGVYYARTVGSTAFNDELYDDIPCPGGACSPTDGTPINVTTGVISSVDFALDPSSGGACLFCDDFEDGVLAADWTYQGLWTEVSGMLTGSSTRKAKTLADPAFSGCNLCSVQTRVSTAGGLYSNVRVLAWYLDGANRVDLIMKEYNDRWVLKQRSGGVLFAKAAVRRPIDPGVTYNVRVVYDGNSFLLYLDGDLAATLAKVPGSNPTGTVGFQVKGTTASFEEIRVTE